MLPYLRRSALQERARPSAILQMSGGLRAEADGAVHPFSHPSIVWIADATLDGTRKGYLADFATVPLLIIDDLGMRKLPHTAAEDLLEITTPPPLRRSLIGCSITQVRAAQLAHEGPDRLAHRGGHEVELHWSRPSATMPRRLIAGFETSTEDSEASNSVSSGPVWSPPRRSDSGHRMPLKAEAIRLLRIG